LKVNSSALLKLRRRDSWHSDSSKNWSLSF